MPAIKLLDLGAKLPSDGHMARPRQIAWPVKAYRVTLPDVSSSSASELNSFERLALKLLEIDGPISDSKLSEETCIPEDFLKGVLLRLQDKGYIDDRNNLRKSARNTERKVDYKSAMVFQEQVEGKALPYVFYDKKPAQKDGNTGPYCWQMQRSEYDPCPISAEDVVKAIKDQKRHDRAYGDRAVLPTASSIRVVDGKEYYHLECPIGMRSSDGEFRIGNPFGKGYSLVLEGIFMRKLEEDPNLEAWISSWRDSLGREREIAEERATEPFDTARNRKLYPNLVASLRPNWNGIRTIEKLYSAVEWSLFYANERVSSRHAINLLKLTKPSDAPSLIKAAADEIGLETPARGYLRVQDQSLDSYQEEVPEMPTALAIAILTAKNESKHPLRKVAETHPDAAVQLYQIKKERDIKSHGKGRGSQDGPNGKNELFVKEFVSTLIPEIVFSDEATSDVRKADAYIDSRFEARSSLLSRFGYAAFNTKLSPLTQDRLVDAESFWAAFQDGENALSFVGDLYAALQSEFSRKVEIAAIRATDDRELLRAIERRAKELRIGPLPDSLSTVRPNNIRKALQGNNETTLGGLVVAYLLSAKDEDVRRILENDKTVFADVGKVIAARGHLNEARAFSKEEVDEYRELTYKTINAMMEER